MTDQELKDLVASLSINQLKMAEEAAISRKKPVNIGLLMPH